MEFLYQFFVYSKLTGKKVFGGAKSIPEIIPKNTVLRESEYRAKIYL